jgi:hypothetical protein
MSEHNQPTTEKNISIRELSRQLGFSNGSGQRFLSSAKKKRAGIANGLTDGWVMLTEEQARSKYTKELLDGLKHWLDSCELVGVIVLSKIILSSNEIEMVT